MRVAVYAVAFAFVAMWACTVGLPSVEAVPTSFRGSVRSDDVRHGKQLFGLTCTGFRCHGGLGPSLGGIRATPGQVRTQVRLGSERMPSLGRAELTDEELEAILAFLAEAGVVYGRASALTSSD